MEMETELLRKLSADLCRCDLISDFTLTLRTTLIGELRLVIYVVPIGSFSLSLLKEQLHNTMTTSHREIDFVPVSTILLGEDGRPDMARLNSFVVITNEVVSELESALGFDGQVALAAVVPTETATSPEVFSLSKIFPDSSSSREALMHSTAGTLDVSPLEDYGQAVHLAQCDGGKLIIPDDAPKTLTAALLRTAFHDDGKGIVFPDDSGTEKNLPYASLLRRARKALSGLHKSGLRPKDKLILQLDNLEQHYISFWACVLGGIIPVTVASPSLHTRKTRVSDKLVTVWEFLDRPKIVASEINAGALQELSVLYATDAFDILVFEDQENHEPAEDLYEPAADDVVFFQLTSGSTGTPKCIQETHQGIIAHIHGSAQSIGYCSKDVTFNWLPVDHVVPILTFHIKDIYLNCTQVHVRPDYILSAPLRWLACIERYRVTHTWAPNFGFKLLCDSLRQEPGKTWDLLSIKYFMNAGEQVTAEVVQDFIGWMGRFGLPGKVMQPAFGMAETCTCITYENHFNLDKNIVAYSAPCFDAEQRDIPLVSLGGPMPGVRIRITDSNNQLLPEGVIGRFQIAGAVVTPGYYRNEVANIEAIVGDGWFNSGDLGFIKNGNLVLTGREKEAFNIRGATIFCHEVEEMVEAINGVEPTFAAAVATHDATTGTEALAIFFVPNDGVTIPDLRQIITREVATNLGVTPIYVIPVGRERFPKTTSGKKQRISLQKALLTGEFKEFVEAAAVARGVVTTLPTWFYRPIWKRKAVFPYPFSSSSGQTLLFVNEHPVSSALYQEVMSWGELPIIVRNGGVYNVINEREFHIDGANADHYQRLFTHMQGAGIRIRDVFHLWTCGGAAEEQTAANLDDEIACGVISVMHLAKTLRNYVAEGEKASIVVASEAAQRVNEGDSLIPARSMLGSLVRTIAQEMPSFACRLVDISSLETSAGVEALVTESRLDDEPEVAYRDGQRLVRRLEKIKVGHEAIAPSPFCEGQFYVLTGGLGGVGMEIAQFLLKAYALRVLLVGRRPLEADAEQMNAYRMLSALPGEVVYESVDVADAPGMDRAISSAATRFGRKLAGVVHMAGIYREQPLASETNASFLQTLMPKVKGTEVLSEVVRRNPGAVFIGFSSVISYFGGAMVGAYAAANRFIESSCESLAGYEETKAYSLCWSSWDGIGLSKNYHGRELLAARGYHAMTAEQGINSFRVATLMQQGSLLIGLDDSKRFIQRNINECYPLSNLSCYVEGKDVNVGQLLDRVSSVHDAYGASLQVEIRQVESIPLDEKNAIDYDALRSKVRMSGGAATRPKGDLESRVAEIWARVLHLPIVSVNDNFFDIGGDSASIARIEYQIKQKISTSFDTIDLFKYPTVRNFCAYLNNGGEVTPESEQLLDGGKRGAIRKSFAANRRKNRAALTQEKYPEDREFHE